MAIENKPSRNEEEYFARENAELIQQLRAQRDAQRSAAAETGAPAATMTCPRCAGVLQEREYHQVKIDECASCGGVWLDRGELELLGHVEAPSRRSFLSGLFRLND